MIDRRQIRTCAGLLLALGFPGLPVSRWEEEFRNVHHLLGYEGIWWGVVGLLLLHVIYLERRPLSSLGIKPPSLANLAQGVLGGILTLAGLAAIFLILFPILHVSESRQLGQLTRTPVWWRVISVIRAAIGEEVLFRGYAISRLRALTGSLSWGAFLSWAIFSLEHVGVWGWGHLLIAGFGGATLTVLFLWKRNLWVSIVAHMIIDGAAVL